MTINAYFQPYRVYALYDYRLVFEICNRARFEDFYKWLDRMEMEGCRIVIHSY